MSEFSSAIASPSRTLSIRAVLTLATGYVLSLTGRDILSYSLTEGASGGDMLLGSALSAHGTLTLYSPDGALRPGGALLGERTLMGAQADVEIGVKSGGDYLYSPAGSFIVSHIEAAEGEDAVTLSGYDALLHRFSPVFSDQLTYPCTLQSVLSHIAKQAGCTVEGTPLCNADAVISSRPDWGDQCTLRQALAWVSGAMGCFARLTRAGAVTLIPLKSSSPRALDAAAAQSLTLEDMCFTFNRLRVHPRGSSASLDRVLDDTLPFGEDNTLEIDDNPLFRAGTAELSTMTAALCRALSGFAFTPFEMTACGDPTLETGDFLTVTDLSGVSHPALLFSQHLTFADGLAARLSCDLQSGGVHLPRIVTSSGKITTDALTDGLIAARHIAAGAVDAEKISARAITADKIALGAITSDSGVIGSLSADSITAGKLSTDRLIVGGTEFSIVRALNQLADSLSENDDSIDGGVLSDKSLSADKVTDDFGTGLELSSNAAVLLLSGKLDGTNSHMELTNDAINMVGGEINIATSDLQIRGYDDGDELMSLDPEGLFAPRVSVSESFTAPNVVMSHPSAAAAWKGGIQASLDALPKFLPQDVTLTVPAGAYAEDVLISGFTGSTLTLFFEPGARLEGSLQANYCSGIVLTAEMLGDAAIYPAAGVTPVSVRYCPHVLISNLHISGLRSRTSDSGTSNGLFITECNAVVTNCCVEYTNTNTIVFQRGTFDCSGCSGGQTNGDYTTNANLGNGVLAYRGAHGTLRGTCPVSANGNKASSGTLLTSSVTPVAGGMEYTAPTEYTKSFAITKHCTYQYGERRRRDDQTTNFSQGRYGEYTSGLNNWRIGAIWFNGATALAGKTIKSATLTLRRASGGWSSAVPVYLGTVDLLQSDFTSTLTPDFAEAGTYPIGTLKRESQAVYDVTDLMDAVVAGKALGVYEPRASYTDGWSPAYTTFYGKGSGYEPVLTVTYQ